MALDVRICNCILLRSRNVPNVMNGTDIKNIKCLKIKDRISLFIYLIVVEIFDRTIRILFN